MGFDETRRHDAVLKDRTLAGMLSPDALGFEPFRVLRSKLRGVAGSETRWRLGLVGAVAGEGATTMSLGLAAALAEEPGKRVLLVEADLREPTIAPAIGLVPGGGLGEWLQDGGDGLPPLCRVEPWGFSLLPAGSATPHSAERLGSERMARLLAEARDGFDVVVVDCAPLTPWADSVALQEHLDGILLVVRARHAERDVVKAAVGHLRPEVLRGLVFNDQYDVLPRLRRRKRTRRR